VACVDVLYIVAMVDPILGLVAMATMFGLFVAGLRLMWSMIEMPPPEFEWRVPLDTGPAEPCWTETIASDGRFAYAREGCVHDLLMELDARANRGDYPIPRTDG
jgi:hypothetical protein